MTRKAVRMELLLFLRLKILTFDSSITGLTDGIIELVIMTLAVRMVLDHIEICCLKRLLTSHAHEAYSLVLGVDLTLQAYF